jgi:hypothetical protein
VELDTIYIILGGQAILMLTVTAIYYALRLSIESRKAASADASFQAMVKYHSQRLDIETEKLELQRSKSLTPSIDEALAYIDALKEKERARSKIIDAMVKKADQ